MAAPLDWGTLRASAGLASQPQRPEAVDPVLGAGPLPAARSTHADLGLELPLPLGLTLSATGYGRWESDLLVERFSFDPFNQWMEILGFAPSGPVAGGARARAWGAELLLRRRAEGRWFGWIAYAYSRAERIEASGEGWHPSPFDQPHALSIVGGVDLGHGFRASGRFRLASGRRYTPAQGSVFDADRGVYYAVPGAADSGQLPSFHSLDLRIERRFLWNRLALTLFLDVENVYSYQPPEGVLYSADFRERAYVRGLFFLPFLGARVDL